MENQALQPFFSRHPKLLGMLLAAVLALCIVFFLWLLAVLVPALVDAVRNNSPAIIFDTKLMMAPGAIITLLFGVCHIVVVWRYRFHTHRTQKKRDEEYKRLSVLVGRGLIVGLILTFGASFLAFNPLVEKYLLTDNGYIHCPNQMQLSTHFTEEVWVKHQATCFDKGFQRSTRHRSALSPAEYLERKQETH